MSKRNRENRARKVKARKPPKPYALPAYARGFEGNGFESVEARKRLAMMIPIMWLADRTPYTEGLELPKGSLIVGPAGGKKRGYIRSDQVPQLIGEIQRELSVSLEEVVRVLVDCEENGLITTVGLEEALQAPA